MTSTRNMSRTLYGYRPFSVLKHNYIFNIGPINLILHGTDIEYNIDYDIMFCRRILIYIITYIHYIFMKKLTMRWLTAKSQKRQIVLTWNLIYSVP